MKTARRLGVSIASSAAVAVCFFSIFTKSGLTQESRRKDYSDKISASYNYRFGKELPFAPGNPEIEDNEFIQPGAFPDATYCAHCHLEAYHQWRQALHANSFREPFYRTSVNLLIMTKGIEYSRHCHSCQNPISVLSGGLMRNSQVDRKFDQNGLTCTVCHSIQAVRSTSGSGGFVMGVPSVMVDEKENRIPGEVPYSEIMNRTDRHVRAVIKDLYRTPEFCAACHKANLPEDLNDFRFISAFTTFNEWQNSKFSHRNPVTFYSGDFKTCQACHMMRAPNTFPDYGAKHGTFASHSWAAGNTAAHFYYGFDEQLEKTVRFLQAGNYLNVDIFGLKKTNTETLIAPLGSVPFSIEPNDVLDACVVIQHKNIGHSVLPEVRDLYEGWVEFTVKDTSGKDIYHSGFLKPDGSLDERAHSFTNRPVDKDGEFVDNHQVQLIHSIAYDNTIASGRSTIVRYQFRVPSNISGPITITAEVNYRHLQQSYLSNVLGKGHPAYSVVQLTARSRTLNIGENQREKPDSNDNPDWMRWNNLGIGYLDALQYSSAVQAFGEAVKLGPDCADAYTNIAVTEIPWEKYESAWDNIQIFLSLSTHNARALHYAALLERRASHPKAKLDDLLEVVKQYPQSRDARRDPGITYYRQGNYHEAMTQFEALQTIDPDDLSAHYNLSILYPRMRMIMQAKEQQALFVTEKINSSARTYSLGYLRSHPESSTESIPWYRHTDLAHVTNSSTQTAQK